MDFLFSFLILARMLLNYCWIKTKFKNTSSVCYATIQKVLLNLISLLNTFHFLGSPNHTSPKSMLHVFFLSIFKYICTDSKILKTSFFFLYIKRVSVFMSFLLLQFFEGRLITLCQTKIWKYTVCDFQV